MSELDKEAARRTYHTLDGMRGLAALAVVTLHTPWMFGETMMRHAFLAVDIFFVLSGLVLAHAYDQRLRDGLSAWGFMKLRLIRLYPLYIAGVLLSVAWIVWSLRHGLPVAMMQAEPWTMGRMREALAFQLFFLPAPTVGAGPPFLYPLNMPAWSLFFEIAVNLVFVLSFKAVNTRVLIAIVAIAAVWLAAAGFIHGGLDAGWRYENFDIILGRVTFGFFAGVLIHRLAPRIPDWVQAPAFVPLLIMAAALFWLPTGALRPWWDIASVLVLTPLLVVLGSRTEPGQWTRPAYSFAGLTSYAVYTLHYPLSYIATYAFTVAGYDSGAYAPVSGAIFLAGLLLVCWLIDRFYDAPVRAWLNRKARQERTVGAAPA